MIKRSFGEKIFDGVNVLLLCLIGFITLFPLWYVFMNSLSNPAAVTHGDVYFWPVGFELGAYAKILEQKEIWSSYGNTIFITFVGTAVSLILSILGAYPLSKRRMHGRKFFNMVMVVTMWFSAGMMPVFLNLKAMGLATDGFTNLFGFIPMVYDIRWTLIIAFSASAFNTILIRTYFESVSDSLEESAKMDGASDWKVLLQIFIPLSVPALMTVGLYYFVERWNSYFWAMVLIRDQSKTPLQVMLGKLVSLSSMQSTGDAAGLDIDNATMNNETMVYSTIMVAVIPMLILYPFIQKFFVKGIMIGAIKG